MSEISKKEAVGIISYIEVCLKRKDLTAGYTLGRIEVQYRENGNVVVSTLLLGEDETPIIRMLGVVSYPKYIIDVLDSDGEIIASKMMKDSTNYFDAIRLALWDSLN